MQAQEKEETEAATENQAVQGTVCAQGDLINRGSCSRGDGEQGRVHQDLHGGPGGAADSQKRGPA